MDNLSVSGSKLISTITLSRQGKLVFYGSSEYSCKLQGKYDKWRLEWCKEHRLDETIEGFREGKLTWEILEFATKLGFKVSNILGGI